MSFSWRLEAERVMSVLLCLVSHAEATEVAGGSGEGEIPDIIPPPPALDIIMIPTALRPLVRLGMTPPAGRVTVDTMVDITTGAIPAATVGVTEAIIMAVEVEAREEEEVGVVVVINHLKCVLRGLGPGGPLGRGGRRCTSISLKP